MQFGFVTRLRTSPTYFVAHHINGTYIWQRGLSKPKYQYSNRFIGLSKNGKVAILGSSGHWVNIINLSTGETLDRKQVNPEDFLPSNYHTLTVKESKLELVNALVPKNTYLIKLKYEDFGANTTLACLAISPDATQFAIITEQEAGGFDTVSGGIYNILGEHVGGLGIGRDYYLFLQYSPYHPLLMVSQQNGNLGVFNTETGRQEREIHTRGWQGGSYMDIHPTDANCLVYIEGRNDWCIQDAYSNIRIQKEAYSVEAVAFTPDGNEVVCLCSNGTMTVYDRETLFPREYYSVE